VVGLAVSLTIAGRLDEACAALETDPERFTPPDGLYMFIGSRYGERGDDEGAAVCYRRALEINPGNEAARAAILALGVDPATIPAAPVASEDALAKFAGAYAQPGGLGEFVVRLEEGALVISGPRIGTAEMQYAGGSAFTLATIPVRIEFEGAEGGAPTTMIIIPPDGQRIPLERVED
jgi:hypothetical protein